MDWTAIGSVAGVLSVAVGGWQLHLHRRGLRSSLVQSAHATNTAYNSVKSEYYIDAFEVLSPYHDHHVTFWVGNLRIKFNNPNVVENLSLRLIGFRDEIKYKVLKCRKMSTEAVKVETIS